jgi:hypothetical protein
MAGILNVDEIADSTGTRPVLFARGVQSSFYETKATIDYSHAITAGHNAMTVGPITIADGITITVPDSSVWTVV